MLTGEDYYTRPFQGLRTDEEAKFHCFAKGSPTPSVKWFKEGVELHDGDLEETISLNSNRGNGLDLKIHPVRMQHAGNYTCWAGNKLGNTSNHVLVLVTREFIEHCLLDQRTLFFSIKYLVNHKFILKGNEQEKYCKGNPAVMDQVRKYLGCP